LNKDLNNLAVVIPAYKPEEALVGLADELLSSGFKEIIVVDDGGGEEFSAVFEQVKKLGCTLLVHEVNKGKGRALKTAFEYIISEQRPYSAVITADADGQHLPKDIIHVGQETLDNENTMVLGGRVFSGKVPLRSRFGNAVTRGVFNLVSGQKVHDTQTGLRGIPVSSLEKMTKLKGERYEFEMNMLLEAKRMELTIKEVEIETVYIDDNSSSHFNPLVDSWKIYKQIFMFSGASIYRHIIMFGGSSLLAFGIDYLVFTLLNIFVPRIFTNISATDRLTIPLLGPKASPTLLMDIEVVLLIAVVGARIVSSLVNFFVNRNVVFGKKGKGFAKHVIGYYILVVIILIANYFILFGFKSAGINVYIAKVFTEAILFVLSFFVQRKVIFK